MKGFFGYNSNPNYLEFFMVILFNFLKKWADFYYIGSLKIKLTFNMEKGNINIQAENIFPIIKKFFI